MSSMNVDDRLSVLPEDISSHILSLMPTKYAVRTSILSKRWRYNWMFVTNLDFDDIHPYHSNDVLPKFVDHVMEHCKSSHIQLFRLKFSSGYAKRSSVSSWIDKAVRLNACEVDIQLKQFEFPLSFFTCKTLTKLRLDVRIGAQGAWECPCSVNLPYLKTLDIVGRFYPFVNTFKLISGCPMLESLSLEVTSSKAKQDHVFNIPTLKRLKLRLVTWTSDINEVVLHTAVRKKKVILNLPNLEYLHVGGKLDSPLSLLFVVVDLSSLVEASISFYMVTFDHLFVELLKAIKGVESLTIEKAPGRYGFVSLSVENKVPFTATLPVFSNMKFLELISVWYLGTVLQLLESCPKLKHLCLDELGYSQWTEPKLAPTCMLKSLTTIKISLFNERKYEIDFLEYILGNAEVLKTVTIDLTVVKCPSWQYPPIKDAVKLVCELQRVAKDCEIHIIGTRI